MGNCNKSEKKINDTQIILNKSNDDENIYFFKIVLVGSSNVGKTSLISRIKNNEFSIVTTSTIGVDYYKKTIKLNIFPKIFNLTLQIWDTAGQDRYRSITTSYYRNTDCVLAMFSITDQKSFDELEYWINEVKKYNENIMLIIIGTKSDLENKRQVSYENGKSYAKSKNAKYYEISAMQNKGCSKIIKIMASNLLKNKIN